MSHDAYKSNLFFFLEKKDDSIIAFDCDSYTWLFRSRFFRYSSLISSSFLGFLPILCGFCDILTIFWTSFTAKLNNKKFTEQNLWKIYKIIFLESLTDSWCLFLFVLTFLYAALIKINLHRPLKVMDDFYFAIWLKCTLKAWFRCFRCNIYLG